MAKVVLPNSKEVNYIRENTERDGFKFPALMDALIWSHGSLENVEDVYCSNSWEITIKKVDGTDETKKY